MTNETRQKTVRVGRPRFDAVLLVCKRCGKRSDGPKKLKPREVANLVRRATRRDVVRSRVVMTSCLGLCPKAAIAVARVASGMATRIVAIAARRQIEPAMASMSAKDAIG